MLFQTKNKLFTSLVDKLKAYYHQMMSLPDSTEKIARGIALGLAFDFLPIPIISIPLSYFVARLMRCSVVAAVATVTCFKLAVPVFFALNVYTGSLLFGYFTGPTIEFVSNNPFIEYLEEILKRGYPFLLGSIVNAVVSYIVLYYYIRRWLQNRKKNRE